MSDNIFGDRFAGYREPAWHHLGKVFDKPISASEAIGLANMNYAIEIRPLQTTWHTGLVAEGLGECLSTVDVPDRFAVVREPTKDDNEPRVLGIVGSRFEPVQNTDIGLALDLLTDRWPVETVGALGYGETTFFVLDAGEISVAGRDAVHKYFLVRDQKDGTRKLHFCFTPVRVVCQNTLTQAGEGEASVDLRHNKGVKGEFFDRIEVVDWMLKSADATEQVFNNMAKVVLKAEDVKAALERCYPMPKKSTMKEREQDWINACERTKQIRGGAQFLIERWNAEQPWAARTAWGVYNGIVETEDYRKGKSAENSLLWGPRANTKKMAYAILSQYK
jgi:phage/plasmid-like protein (TIGR03299 family)